MASRPKFQNVQNRTRIPGKDAARRQEQTRRADQKLGPSIGKDDENYNPQKTVNLPAKKFYGRKVRNGSTVKPAFKTT